jgi:hypothetical protein
MSPRARIVVLASLLAWVLPSFAQSERNSDFGIIAGADFSIEFSNGLELEMEEELRFKNAGGAHLDRWLNELSVESPLSFPGLGNRLHLGCFLGYVRHYDDKGYYDNRFRYGVDVSYRESIRRFKLACRSRLMFTYRDERTGDYSVNPKWYWRNKFQATYQMPNSRYKYALSTEFFLRLREDPSEVFIDHLRTTFTIDYRLTRRQSISLAARMDNDIQVRKPVDCFYLGITYNIKY